MTRENTMSNTELPGRGSVTRSHLRRLSLPLGTLAALVAIVAPAAPAGAAPLADGRVYEQVSPIEKYGAAAGAAVDAPMYAAAAPDGDGLLYGVAGPIGSAARGIQNYAVGRRSASSWSADNPFPLPPGAINFNDYAVGAVGPSEDLQSFAYSMSGGGLVPGNPQVPHGFGSPAPEALYRTSTSGPLAWLTAPTIDPATPVVGQIEGAGFFPVGGSPDLDTVYFGYYGTLVPEDAPRAANVTDRPTSPKGLYRYAAGQLTSASILPDGSTDPYGAMPAGSCSAVSTNGNNLIPLDFRNQVSADGARAFFVSPDPNAGSGRPPQLYVRKDGTSTVLASRSAVTGDEAPSGVTLQARYTVTYGGWPSKSCAYASRDGSHVFFESVDPLTADAPVDGAIKGYVFDVDHETLAYLPGVTGDVVAASDDLSRFLFASGSLNAGSLSLWDHDHVTLVSPRVRPTAGTFQSWVTEGRATSDGSTFLFQSTSELPGFNNAGGVEEVYRYDVGPATLACLSCAPGSDPAVNGSHLSSQGGGAPLTSNMNGQLRDNRGMSDDGRRVFFDTTTALVDSDTNGVRDVYEWEDGVVHLISSGIDPHGSFVLDNSESGDDVFFATREGLDEADRDGGYDVYDARVGGGFPKVPEPPVCLSNCRAPAGPAPPASPPVTLLSEGAGNVKSPAPVASKITVTKKSARGNAVTATVKVPGAGALTASGEGLGTVKRSVLKGGTYRLRVTLTKKARRTLARERKLRVHVHLRYRPVVGFSADATASLTIKAAKRS